MKTTKYIAIRETYGTDNRMHRRYEEYQTAGIAVAWFKGSDLGVGRTVSIYEVECDGDELPCAKKEIPEHGTLIFRKKNAKVLYEKPAEEANEEEAPDEATAEESSVVPVDATEPVRYYAVLKIAENRKHTKFHYKRRTFLDDEDAIRFARSRLRGGCVSASVYMYDPTVTRYPPQVFESTSAQRDARDILRLLPDTKIFYASKTMDMDLRDVVHDWLTHRLETA